MSSENLISLDIKVPNETRYLRLLGDIAEAIARALDNYSGDRETLAYHLNVVLTEATANAIEHAVPASPSGHQTVRVNIAIEDKDLRVCVHDDGKGFDLDAVPSPDFAELEERGRGIFMIRSLMDDVCYKKTQEGNVLEMHKKLT